MTRPRTRQQQHVVQILWAKPPGGAPVQHGWQCTCGDSQAFSGPLSISSAWTSAQMHAYLWGGVVA